MKLFTLEALIALLLLASAAAVVANQYCQRELVVDLSRDWICMSADDNNSNGGSDATAYKTGEAHRMDFLIRDKHSNPFTALIIRKAEEELFDLSWMESISLEARCESNAAQRPYFNFHIRTNADSYTTQDDPSSLKYNETVVRPGTEFSSQTIHRKDFRVPSWWIQKYNVTKDDRDPSFGNAKGFEITTVDREGEGFLEIRKISIQGHWISPAALNQLLLVTWMSTFMGVLLFRICMLRNKLLAKLESEKDLLSINEALSLQSKELSEMASQDPLTGLYNRRGARDSILSAMSKLKQDETEFALIMFDIDRFKKINDIKGHAFADSVLSDIATLSRQRARAGDCVVRWGGEEFLIICPATNIQQAMTLAESLRSEFERSELNYTASFGICSSIGFDSFSGMLEAVDMAMYNSKDKGRNRVSEYQENKPLPMNQATDSHFPSLDATGSPFSGMPSEMTTDSV